MLTDKKALLLDMNSTFMFGEDRFGDAEDFSIHYHQTGGQLEKPAINQIIRAAYQYLDERYPDETYRHHFPSIETAIHKIIEQPLPPEEVTNIIDTFAYHERGHIPQDYVDVLYALQQHFILAVVIDIWSPKQAWLETFDALNITHLFSASSFSSDHGIVKPSPKPFEQVLTELNIPKHQSVIIGDSPRRDLGSAVAAGIDCILVGDAKDSRAIGHYASLLDLCQDLL